MLRVGRGRWIAPVAAAAALSGCANPQSDSVGTSSSRVVYGEDDRKEPFEVDDEALRALAEETAMAIMPAENVVESDGAVELTGTPLSQSYILCDGQRFADQPVAAVCSGFLFGPDLVVTAGHCARLMPCAAMRLVMGFYNEQSGDLRGTTTDDVYSCAEILANERSPPEAAERLDYAFIRLDRKVPGFVDRGIAVRRGVVAAGEPLVMFGFPNGIPLKIDSGGQVTDPRTDTLDYFMSTTDSFYSSSGSPLFDAAGALVGIQNRGATDYERSDQPCDVVARVTGDPPVGAEAATYALRAVDGLCESVDDPHCESPKPSPKAKRSAPDVEKIYISGGGACTVTARGSRGSATGAGLAGALVVGALRRRRVRNAPPAAVTAASS